MIGLLRRWFDLHRDVENQLRTDVEMLKAAARSIDEWQRLTLVTTENTRDLLIAWRLSLEIPEQDYRDDVTALIREYDDQLARLTEQIVT